MCNITVAADQVFLWDSEIKLENILNKSIC